MRSGEERNDQLKGRMLDVDLGRMLDVDLSLIANTIFVLVRRSTDLYEVCGFAEERLEGNTGRFNEMYSEAMKLYFEREFTDAFDKFEEASKIKGGGGEENDLSCLLLQKRCIEYMDNPPDSAWDGSSILISK